MLVDEALALVRVARPDAAPSPNVRVVGERDRFVDVAHAKQRATGPNISSRYAGESPRDVREHGRRVEVARSVSALAAGQHARARRHARVAPAASRSSTICGVASGPMSVAASSGSPTRSARMRGDEAPLELVGDRARAR